MTPDDVAAVWRRLRADGASTAREVMMRTGLAPEVVSDIYRVLVATGFARLGKRKRLSIRSRVDIGHVLAVIDFGRRRALQVMQPGTGNRRDDCARYDECLDAFARAHGDKVDGHCPRECERFVPWTEDWKRTMHDAVARKEWG